MVAGALALGGAAAWVLKQQASPPPMPAPVVEAPLVPAPPPPPAAIIVTLSAEPAGAHITAGGVELTCNPCRLSGPPGSRQPVRVSAPGMAERSLDVLFDQARTETVALVALPPVAPVAEAAVDAGQPGRRKKAPRGLSVDEKNPYQ